jgi:hypothetical protein
VGPSAGRPARFEPWAQIAAQPGLAAHVRWAGLKPRARAVEKAHRRHGGDPARVLDYCRQTLFFPGPDALLCGLRAVTADPDVRLVRVRAHLRPAAGAGGGGGNWRWWPAAGWVGLSVRLAGMAAAGRLGLEGHVCELRLALADPGDPPVGRARPPQCRGFGGAERRLAAVHTCRVLAGDPPGGPSNPPVGAAPATMPFAAHSQSHAAVRDPRGAARARRRQRPRGKAPRGAACCSRAADSFLTGDTRLPSAVCCIFLHNSIILCGGTARYVCSSGRGAQRSLSSPLLLPVSIIFLTFPPSAYQIIMN